MRYGGSVEYWAVAWAAGGLVVDISRRYNKREKATHRMDICDTHGHTQLTVPITWNLGVGNGELRPLRWSDIDVSAHGHWWTIHLTALRSAYGRTPFYEFYEDLLLPLYTSRYEHERVKLWELNREMDSVIAQMLEMPAPQYIQAAPAVPPIPPLKEGAEYWQVRADKFGFMPGLSILDLIFNLGPEAQLHLERLTGVSPK